REPFPLLLEQVFADQRMQAVGAFFLERRKNALEPAVQALDERLAARYPANVIRGIRTHRLEHGRLAEAIHLVRRQAREELFPYVRRRFTAGGREEEGIGRGRGSPPPQELQRARPPIRALEQPIGPHP